VMAHAQKPDFVFRRNGRVHLNRRGRQFSRLLAAEVCASAVVMLDTTCSEVVWRVLATHSIRQFPLHFPSRASPCTVTFQLDSNNFQCVHIRCVYKRGGGGRQNNFNKKQTSRREGRKHIKIRDRNMGTNKQGNKTTERIKITDK